VLERVERGEIVPPAELAELVVPVLAEPRIARALEALAGGEHAIRAALELAAEQLELVARADASRGRA